MSGSKGRASPSPPTRGEVAAGQPGAVQQASGRAAAAPAAAELTTAEAAEVLEVSTATLKRWTRAGLVASERTKGGHRRFKAEALRALVASQRHADAQVSKVTEDLLAMEQGLQAQAALLRLRGELGSWGAVLERLFPVAAELHRRRDSGALTTLQWSLAYERITRGLQRFQELAPPPSSGPTAILATVPGDPLALVPAALELCLPEVGWRTRWGGRASPADLEADLARAPAQGVVLCASAGADDDDLARLAPAYLALARRLPVPLATLGLGDWPTQLPRAVRFRTWAQLRGWLVAVERGEGQALLGEAADLSRAAPPRWRPELAVGHEVIDRQHAGLFHQVGSFADALQAGVGRADIARMLRFLGEYVASHFRTEEQVMREVGHPDLTEHTWEHERFIRRFLALTRALERKGEHPAEAQALRAFLSDWLELHVGGSDQRLRDLLAARRGA